MADFLHHSVWVKSHSRDFTVLAKMDWVSTGQHLPVVVPVHEASEIAGCTLANHHLALDFNFRPNSATIIDFFTDLAKLEVSAGANARNHRAID